MAMAEIIPTPIRCTWSGCTETATGQVLYRLRRKNGDLTTWVKSEPYCDGCADAFGPPDVCTAGTLIAREVLAL